MRHLSAIVEIAALPMLDARQEVTLCGGVAPQLVRDDDAWVYCKSFSSL